MMLGSFSRSHSRLYEDEQPDVTCVTARLSLSQSKLLRRRCCRANFFYLERKREYLDIEAGLYMSRCVGR